MKKVKYDVFVSYRRTAYDTANLIAEKLRHAGYRVFVEFSRCQRVNVKEYAVSCMS